MIECSEERIYYKKHRKSRFRRCFSFFLALIIIFVVLFYYKNFVTTLIYGVCYKEASAICSDSVNKSILTSLKDQTLYDELVTIEKDKDGNIVLMTANAYKMNVINRDTAVKTQALLSKKLDEGIEMPYLIFTGIDALSGYGRKFAFKTLYVSSVNCEFKSNFTSVGINQTLHSIYLSVISKIIVDLPFAKEEAKCVTDILICESVLVGKVPEVYLNGKLLG